MCRTSVPRLSGAHGHAGQHCGELGCDIPRAGADSPRGADVGSWALGRAGGALGMGREGSFSMPLGPRETKSQVKE